MQAVYVAMSSDGSKLLGSLYTANSAVLSVSGGPWTSVSSSAPPLGMTTVAMSGDGNVIVLLQVRPLMLAIPFASAMTRGPHGRKRHCRRRLTSETWP